MPSSTDTDTDIDIAVRAVILLRGPKLSDRRFCAALGCTHDEAREALEAIRKAYGARPHQSVRAIVRAARRSAS